MNSGLGPGLALGYGDVSIQAVGEERAFRYARGRGGRSGGVGETAVDDVQHLVRCAGEGDGISGGCGDDGTRSRDRCDERGRAGGNRQRRLVTAAEGGAECRDLVGISEIGTLVSELAIACAVR